MFANIIATDGVAYLNTSPAIHKSASTADVFLYFDIPFASGRHEIIIDTQSFLDDYSFEFDDLKSIMLLSEKVLSREWNSQEEDEAWAHL